MSRNAVVITQLLVVSLAWVFLSLLFCGIGALVRRAFHARGASERDLFFDWWVGWSVTVVLLLAWHLALPITSWAFVPLALAAGTGAWLTRREWSAAERGIQRDGTPRVALVALVWLTVAALALGPDRHYDTGLYHLPSVRWAQAYAAVPGLGNVDGRFGTNSSFFLFAALVQTIKIHGTELRLASGVLFLPLILQGVLTVYAAAMGRREMDVVRWFQALLIPVALWKARQYAPALSPDGVVFILTVVISGELLRLLGETESRGERASAPSYDYRMMGIVLLTAVVVTVKLSSAVFAIAAAAIALWRWRRLGVAAGALASQQISKGWVRFLPFVSTGILVALLWMAHGVVLSGYAAYPSTFGPFPVDWRVPPTVLHSDKDWIVAWARSPGMHPREVLGNYDWVPGWLAAIARDRDILGAALFLAAAVVIRLAYSRRGQPDAGASGTRGAAFLVPSLVSIPVWLVTAPAVRFTLGPLWAIAVGTLALSMAGTGYTRLSSTLRILLPGFLALTLAAASAIALEESRRAPSRQDVKRMGTLSGLTIFMPVFGDRCGDAPLPCSSKPPDQRLELRKPGSLAKGFRIAR